MPPGKKSCPDDEFIITWQRAKTCGMAAKLTGYGEGKVAQSMASRRAGVLRARGVPLKSFRGIQDVERLIWLAQRARRDDSGSK